MPKPLDRIGGRPGASGLSPRPATRYSCAKTGRGIAMMLSNTLARMTTFAACAIGLAASASAEPKNLGPLAWMVGCWQSSDGANVETWTAPVGGVMFGYATTMKNGQLAFFEQARIDLRRDRYAYSVS